MQTLSQLTLSHGSTISTLHLMGVCTGEDLLQGETPQARDQQEEGCCCCGLRRVMLASQSSIQTHQTASFVSASAKANSSSEQFHVTSLTFHGDMRAQGPPHPIQEHSVHSVTVLMRGHAKQTWGSARAYATASGPSTQAAEWILSILPRLSPILVSHGAKNGAK